MSPATLAIRAAAFAIGAVLLVACSSTDPSPAAAVPEDVGPVDPEPRVAVDDNVFTPEDLVVEVGTEVTWAWEGRAVHDVVGDGFESEVVAEGTFTHTFDAEGAYHYVCSLHPGMEGTVFVVPEGS